MVSYSVRCWDCEGIDLVAEIDGVMLLVRCGHCGVILMKLQVDWNSCRAIERKIS